MTAFRLSVGASSVGEHHKFNSKVRTWLEDHGVSIAVAIVVVIGVSVRIGLGLGLGVQTHRLMTVFRFSVGALSVAERRIFNSKVRTWLQHCGVGIGAPEL